jgi:hypothetical protein
MSSLPLTAWILYLLKDLNRFEWKFGWLHLRTWSLWVFQAKNSPHRSISYNLF